MCEVTRYVPIKHKSINWINIGDDDFYAMIDRNGMYIELRVEQMLDDGGWWACFYINGVMDWDNNGSWKNTLDKAKRQVITELNKYLMRA